MVINHSRGTQSVVVVCVVYLAFLDMVGCQCDTGFAPEGGFRDIVIWMGKWGIQSMAYGGGVAPGPVEFIAGSTVKSGMVNGAEGSARFGLISSAVLLPGTSALIVADTGNSILRKVDYRTKYVTTFLDVIRVNGFPQDRNGVGSEASIVGPAYLSIAKNSDVLHVCTAEGLRTVQFPSMIVDTFYPYTSSFYPLESVISSDGSFFILTDAIKHRVYRLDNATKLSTVAGDLNEGCADGVGFHAGFNLPYSAVILSNGTRAYIADNLNYAIRILDPSSMTVTTLVGTCPATQPTATEGYRISIGWVSGMVLSSDEKYLLVQLYETSSLSRIDLVSGYVNQILPASGQFMQGANIALVSNVPAQCVQCASGMVSVSGIACEVCPLGYFCTNSSSKQECKTEGSYCAEGSVMESVCPSGSYCPSPKLCFVCPELAVCPNGSTTPALFANGSLCAPGSGPKGGVRDIIVWVGGYGIQSMAYDRTSDASVGDAVELIAGTETTAGFVDGVGGVVRFGGLSSAVLLPDSKVLIVADKSNGMLRRVDFKTKNVTTILGAITVGGVKQNIDGVGSNASISLPTHLLMAKNSNLIYVFTMDNIRTVTYPDMVVGTLPGFGLSLFSTKPTISDDGKFFIVSDFVTNLVYKVELKPSIVVSTVGGSTGGCTNGIGTDALFNYPSASAILSNGTRAYIADNYNYGIRILDTGSLAVTSLVGSCPLSTPSENMGYRISVGFMDAMVLSADETFLIVLFRDPYIPSRIDLLTGYVNPITPVEGRFFAGKTLALILNIQPLCFPCEQGRYSVEGFRCEVCPAGYVCKFLSTVKPLACDLGTFCPAGSITALPCAEGSFCPNASISLMCEAGYFCPWRSVFPIPCVAKQYCPANASHAVPCPRGSFCSSPSTVKICGYGSYCVEGSTSETVCVSGNFCQNSSIQLPCHLGTFCPEGSILETPCPEKYYCSDPSSILICPLGTFCELGSFVAVPCPRGSFCSNPSTIKKCGYGSYCVEGSTSETVCAPGNFCQNTSVQLPCPLGTFCPEGSTSHSPCPETYYCSDPSSLLKCPLGKFCSTGSSVAKVCVLQEYCPMGSSFAKLCPSGSFCKDPSSIMECSSGAYCPIGSIFDTKCPAGAFCETPTSFQNCSSGSYCPPGSTAESPCLPGYFCPSPSRRMLCPQGTFCVAKSTEPAVCRGGELCDILGGSAVGVCPVGSYCVAGEAAVVCPFQSTSREGSDSIDDCVCDLGFSLFANTSCEIITEKVPEPSFWSAGVIAGVVVAVVVVVAGLVTGVVLWVRSHGGVYAPLAKAVSAPNLGNPRTVLMRKVLGPQRK